MNSAIPFFFWIFGYPAIPKFDFTHGSGVTLGMGRHLWLFWGLHFLFIPLVIFAFKRRIYLYIIIPLLFLWLLFAHTSLHNILISYMGHGMELAMAGIFFYRATTGVALEKEYERPIYATLAFYLIIDNIMFSINLLSKKEFRYLYENDIRGIVNDFHNIAFFT